MANEFVGFDTSDIEIEEESNEELFDLRAPKFDVKSGGLVVNGVGQVEIGNEIDAYRFWVMKCLLTERYKYPAYSTDFGVEIEEIIRSEYPRDVAESEIERSIQEALAVDSRTISASSFEFEWVGDSIQSLTFTIESIYGMEDYKMTRGGDENVYIGISNT